MGIPLISDEYFVVKPHGLSQAQTITAYLGGSAFQTVMDNPITAYRQLVQQYAKDLKGNTVDPKIAVAEARSVFTAAPVSACMSGVGPRLIGVGFKRIPKFGILLGISFFIGDDEPGVVAAIGASLGSAFFINPIRMIEKQQRAFFKETGASKPIVDIVKESAAKNFTPLFRGTIPLMGHSLASALLGLVGQPKLQKWVQKEMDSKTGLGRSASGLVASSIVSPMYVFVTNPLSRLEVIMQTSSIQKEKISVVEAVKQVVDDSKKFGLRGVFRGQGIGIAKAIISLTLFHEGRLYIQDAFKHNNEKNGYIPAKAADH